MKVRRLSFAAVVTASLLASGRIAVAAEPPPNIEGPFASGNLAVYLIHGTARPSAHPYLTLKDGLASGVVLVHEVQQVNQLEVENRSDRDLFLQAGEIVKGGQQDRTLATDLIVAAHSGRVPIDAHCVEHGRWTQRGNESMALFSSSENSLATKDLRRANYAQDQSQVWDNVAKAQGQLKVNRATPATAPASPPAASARGPATHPVWGDTDPTPVTDGLGSGSPTSLQLTLEDKAVQGQADACVKRLPSPVVAAAVNDVVGYAFAVNGKFDGGDVYGSRALFAKLYPKLLNAAALEAVIDQPPGNGTGDAAPPPSAAAVAALLAAADVAPAKPVAVNSRVRMLVNQPRLNDAAIAQQSNAPAADTAPARTARNVRGPGSNGPDQTGAAPTTAPSATRAMVVNRSTDEVDEYETRDTAVGNEPFLHRTYLAK